MRSSAIILQLAALLLAVFLHPVAAETHIRIGTYRHYPPWTFDAGGGRVIGFEPDMVEELCRRLQSSCVMSPVAWETVFQDLTSGVYDAYIGGMSITEERSGRVAFTTAYGTGTASFATLEDAPLSVHQGLNRINLDHQTEEDRNDLRELSKALQGRSVGVHVGTTNEQFIERFLAGVSDIRRFTDEQEMYDTLLAGGVDAVFADNPALYYLVWTHQERPRRPKLFGPLFAGRELGSGVGGAVRLGNDALRTRLDAAIASAKADGTLQRLSMKWFGFNIVPP